jgi:hypothetical protein
MVRGEIAGENRDDPCVENPGTRTIVSGKDSMKGARELGN